ncbi:MAG: cysteine hydrolase [Oscillospiraceae bacterium]|nr:cysteine hydrolase [Oscillospiraceae bacterium]
MKLNPEKSALLVIDMQEGFLNPESPTYIPMAWETVPRCIAVQRKARELGIPVYFVIRRYAKDGSDVEFTRYFTWKEGGKPCSGPESPIGWNMPKGFEVLPWDNVLFKPRYSAFFNTHLDGILRRKGIDTVIVTGTTTPNCIRATVFDAISLDYNTVVLDDCTSSVNEEVQRVNMLGMQSIGAVIATADDFIKEQIDLPVTVAMVREDLNKGDL